MSLVQCSDCKNDISEDAFTCPHCGASFEGEKIEVTVTDVNISYGNLTLLLVKLVLAIFPALIILSTILYLLWLFFVVIGVV